MASVIIWEIQIKPQSISFKLSDDQHLFFISYSLLFKNFTDIQQILESKTSLLWLKN